MNSGNCCGHRGRRVLNNSGWLVPAAILALLPKCPACFVMYFAIATGFGLSVTTAAYLRVLLAAVSVASLVWLAVKQARYIQRRRLSRNRSQTDLTLSEMPTMDDLFSISRVCVQGVLPYRKRRISLF